jgi:hypothetical protein
MCALAFGASILFIGKLVFDIAEVSRFEVKNLKSSLARDGGRIDSIPREVTEAGEIVSRRLRAGVTVRLSEELAADPFIQQRMWEALYPVRFSQDKAVYVISRNPGPAPGECHVIERGTHVVLARCP